MDHSTRTGRLTCNPTADADQIAADVHATIADAGTLPGYLSRLARELEQRARRMECERGGGG